MADQFLSADPSKYVTLPIQNERIWKKYQNTLDSFWTVHDIYVTNDHEIMMKTFNEEQRSYITKLLAFMYATHCTTINKDLFMKLITQIEIKEASYYFASQADSKKTHSLMYSMLLDELCDDGEQKESLISEVISLPEVRGFLKWSIQKTSSDTKSFAQRLLAFATLQGIIFSGPFVLFGWLQKNSPNMMPGLSHSNELIWRDERLNLSLSCMLFEFVDQLTEEEAHDIVREAVFHAKNLMTKALPVSILGLECSLIEQYIEHSADQILSEINVARLYHKESPFDWVVEPIKDVPASMNFVDLSNSFGEAKFSTDLDF